MILSKQNREASSASKNALAQTIERPLPAKAGPETILVVEDDPDLRELVASVLEADGYRVIAAATPTEALGWWETHKAKIQLLLTDIAMPNGMTGQQLAGRLRGESPHLPILFTSGFDQCDLPGLGEAQFLGKPYRPAKLLQTVRETLDRAPRLGCSERR